MSNKFGLDWYRRPELIMADLIMRAATGEDRASRHYHRAVVLAVDLDGGMLQNENGGGSVDVVIENGTTKTYSAIVGPASPRGSIKARVLTDGLDRLLDDNELRVFWPMFPYDQIGIPISAGEHVYVVFEGNGGFDHGLWMSRVSGHDSANSFQGVDSYTAPSYKKSAMDSFEPNQPEYDLTDEGAGMTSPVSAMSFFNGE